LRSLGAQKIRLGKKGQSKEIKHGPEGGSMIRTLDNVALLEGASRRVRSGLIFLPCLLAFFVPATSASAATTASPGFTISSYAEPTHFSTANNAECVTEGGDGFKTHCEDYRVTATNSGSVATSGPVALTDTVPAGLAIRAVELSWSGNKTEAGELAGQDCGGSEEHVVRCSWEHGVPGPPGEPRGPEQTLAPDEFLQLNVYVTVNEGSEAVAEGTRLTNRASVSGGGAARVSTQAESSSNEVDAAEASFGATGFDFFVSGLNGAVDDQAGDHPYELTTTFELNDAFANPIRSVESGAKNKENVGAVKDIVVNLPLGFVGSTLSAPECPIAQLSSKGPPGPFETTTQGEVDCPADTIVGHLRTEPQGIDASINSPIYNLVPEHGHPAEFGYVDILGGAHVFYTQVVPTPEGYVLQTSALEIPESDLRRITATFYGDPATRDDTADPQVPFFTNPTNCSGNERKATLYIDSWEHPGSYEPDGAVNPNDPNWKTYTSEAPPVTGCNTLQFTPELEAQPTTHEADKPTGLSFGLKVFQNEVFGTSATPDLKNIVVKFPEGMTVDPSSADGLGTCSEQQIGFEGPTLFDFNSNQPQCPESSKIGELELESPLIPRKLYGEMYLASQNANPFGSTFALYVVVDDPITGVLIKLPGELKLNPTTGQITSVFRENPQLPFSNLKLKFFGGPRAELATPNNCGIYTTHTEMEPWSFEGTDALAAPTDSYAIESDCPSGFDPGFTGGSTNLSAGAYTTFQASFERQDNDQELSGGTFELPPGMLADVSSVTQCSQAQIQAEVNDAAAGGCPESSKVGTTTAGAGPGPDPLFVPGNVYWTGPYNGHGPCTPGLSEPGCAPFGLAVVVSANPGPFHFGNVVVRQRLFINKETAAATDVSDPFPTILHVVAPNGETNGIPIKLRRVDVEINRPGFAFNPTNCAKDTFHVGGDISSTAGASKALATPFQITNCAHLKFEPKFSVSVTGKNSKEGGSALTAKVTEPNVPQGTDAGIHLVKVELPKQLPSRLTTLQKACTDRQFNEDPANCPKASKIGMAIVHTPILPEPLMGPAIFVSHGGEAFPSLTLVLQGDGVTIDLVGTTFISKTSITSTTFKTIPDTPFSSFQLTLPQGDFSALGTNVPEKDKYSLCGQKLVMPNEFIAQNGAAIHQKTTITVTGCGKIKKKTKHKKSKRKK
jgi:hypothetical protein